MVIVTRQTETNRIQQHLQAVEQQLRAKQPSLPPKQLEERAHNLDRLHEYWVQGEFPRNYTHPHQQIPCFIDQGGRVCAVAHLLLTTGNTSLAHQIASTSNHALLPAMAFPLLNDWVSQSGLTLDELSLIQPTYSCDKYCFSNLETTEQQKPPRIKPVSKALHISVAAQGGLIAIAPDLSLTSLDRPTFVVYVHGQLEARRERDPAGSGKPITTAEFALMQRESPSPGRRRTSNSKVKGLYPMASAGSDEPFTLMWRDRSSTPGKQSASTVDCLYSASITLPQQPAMLCLSLPALETTQRLEHGVDYVWQFNLQGQLHGYQDRFLSALVKRMPLKPALLQQLKRVTSLEQAALLSKEGLWYDALAIMVEQLSTDPGCASLQEAWQQLLQEVGLERLAAVPLVQSQMLIHHPCQATVKLEGHQQRVYSANCSPAGQWLVTASEDKTVRLWNFAGASMRPIQHQQVVSSASFSPDGQLILTTSQHGTVQLWNLAGQQVAKVKHLREDNAIQSAKFSPDGHYIVSTSNAETKVWHLSGKFLCKLDAQQHGKIRDVSFSANSRSFLTATASAARLWDLNGNLISEFQVGQEQIFGVADQYLFTSGQAEVAKVWAFSGTLVTELKGHFSAHSSAKLSPDGKNIVTTSVGCAPKVWTLAGDLIAELKEHFSAPYTYSANFSPDGKQIVTASNDRIVRIWTSAGDLIDTFGHPTHAVSAHFSPDGHYVITVCDDPIVRLWAIR